MPRYDARDADCRIFTFKEGLLSAVAHDLELVVRTFEVEVSDGGARVTATFDPRSIAVVDAMVDGRRAPGALSDRDKDKIASNIASDVIPVKRHPRIRFESTEVRSDAEGWAIRGRLELAGQTRELVFRAKRSDGHALAEVLLHQPDFGIKPYSAMFGALKLKPDVRVTLRLPMPA
jgi:polyisoprenoid-binding protein YceI